MIFHRFNLPNLYHNLSALILTLGLVSSTSVTHAQSLDTLLSDTPQEQSVSRVTASSFDNKVANSDVANNGAAITSTEEDFLPVEEAYQLSITRQPEGLSLDWVIADAYFLYGEQFRFTVNDKTVEADIPDGLIQYDPIFEKDVEKHYQFVQARILNTDLPERFSLEVTSQGCADAGLCYPPYIQTFAVDGNIITEVSDNSISSDTPKVTANEGTLNLGATPIQPADLTTILAMLAFAIVGGSILNLMPCVLPVLSLKALSLANSKQSHRMQGLAYTIGVLSTFIFIAAILLFIRTAGQSVGWGFQLQSPGFITLLIFLFFTMGLVLSGFMTIGTRWMGMGQGLTQGEGLKQSYFTGVLAAVVASPCTAPFMAPALGFAITQPWFTAILIFAGLGFGMALPLLLLSYLPQLARWLPQPGAWMDTFKQAMAFPLYLTAIWLLWVLSRQLGADTAILVITAALLMLFIIWLGKKSALLANVTGLAVIVLAISMSWYNSQSRPVIASTSASEWEPYNEQRLSDLRQQGRPVFINLTADWCITCLANEKLVFTDNTIEMMKNKGIVLVKGDWTNYDATITRLLEKYRRGGVPLYLLYPAEANAPAIVLPQILTPQKFKSTIATI